MKKLLFLIALVPFLALSQNNNTGPLLNVTEITVKQGHNEQFMDAVKKWKACYLENNGTDKWNFWRRLQGEGTFYIMAGLIDNWAEMDKEDAAGKTCRLIILNDILPHVEKTNYRMARSMPDISRGPAQDMGLVWVTHYKVNNNDDFNEIIDGVTAAIKAKEGSHRGFWYSNIGGPSENSDFFVSTPFRNFAELDIQRDTPAKIYRDAIGDKKMDEMIKKWRAAVDDEWSYILTLNKELSNR